MAEGSVYKRCTCKDGDGRRLGPGCPQLRRPGGGWAGNHGVWGYQLELPLTPSGRRRQLRRSGFDTRDAALDERDRARALLRLAAGDETAAAEIATLLQQTRTGAPLPDRDAVARRIRAGLPAASTMTVEEYLRQWHTGRRLAPKTLLSYAEHIRLYLIPHLGTIPLQQLKASHIEAMFTAIAARNAEITANRVSGPRRRTLGPASQQRLRATLRKALNDAIRRHKLIDHNPAVGIELPSGRRPKARVWTDKAVEAWKVTRERPSPVMVWTPEQAGAFLDYAEAHDIALYPMLVLILHRGLRRGEACGLREQDIDLGLATATIVQQITTVGHATITTPVKSDAGDRTIPLDSVTVAVLRDYLARKDRWRKVSRHGWIDNGLLFVKPDGSAWHPNHARQRFEQLVLGSGLPPVRLHDLRHCAATFLRHSGADLKEVQETLGHSSIVLTADTYTSVIVDLQRANAEAAGRLIPRNVVQ